MKKQKTTTKISGMGVLYIVVSLAAAFFFCWQIYGNLNEIDTKLVGDYMKDSATNMQRLKSYSGNSVAEAYYNDHGEYLEGESKVYNAQLWFQKRTSIAVDVIGLLACFVLLTYGMTKSVTVKTSSQRQVKATSSSSKEGNYSDDEL